MNDNFSIAKLNLDNLKDSAISSALRTVSSKWMAFASEYYRDWDYKPRCGHFFGGVYNYEVETSATIMVASVLSAVGEYDEINVGVNKERLIEMAVRAIRYLCYTHHTGPADCFREKGRNPRTSGKKWGYAENNFFMSSQTGVSVSMMGLASWLLWEHMDIETREMVCRVIEFYADEFSEIKPGTGVYNDTQCEENAWTSLGIAAALYMFPKHPRTDIWREGYINWSLNSVTTYKDKLDKEKDKVTNKSRDGIVHNGKTYGISSVTFHPDFTTENHGYIHPDYMGAGIILRISSAVFPLLAGKEPLESLTYNFCNLYDRVLKPWCMADGNPIPVQGQDWYYHKHHNKLIIHAAMNLFFDDADAAMFERNCIDIMERRQKSTGRGCLLEKNGEVLEVTPGTQSAFDMEYGSIRTVILTYLLHLLKGEGVKPELQDNVMKKLQGNYMYPFGGVYICRTKDSFASFTTRCSIMGLSVPSDGLWDITSDFQGFTGIIQGKKTDDGYFEKKKINWRNLGTETTRENINKYNLGFSIMTEVPRANGGISQMSSFTALPDGKTVYMEKIKVNRNIDISIFETGKISIGNENFEYMPEYAKGYRDIYFNGRAARFYGNYEGKDIVSNYKNIRFINIDDKIGYIVHGSDKVEYRNIHKYPKWKGLEDILILNKRDAGPMEAGDETGIFAVVSLPNTKNSDMPKEYKNTRTTVAREDCTVLRIGKTRVSANFKDIKKTVTEFLLSEGREVDLFSGLTVVQNGKAVCEYSIDGFSSQMDKSAGKLIFKEGAVDLRIMCNGDNRIWIQNESKGKVSYAFVNDGQSREIKQPGMSMKEL